MAHLHTTGVSNYDAHVFRDWLPVAQYLHLGKSADFFLQCVPKGAIGKNETDLKPLVCPSVILFRRGGRGVEGHMGGRQVRGDLAPGTYVCADAGASGSCLSDPENAHNVFHLHFKPETYRAVTDELRQSLLVPTVVGSPSPLITLLADRLLTEAGCSDRVSDLLVDWISGMILMEIIKADQAHALSGRQAAPLTSWQVRKVREYLDANLCRNVSLEEVANVVGLSQFHFARSFKKTVGVPPYQYQQIMRLERSKQLLATTDMQVIEIALCVGYETPHALARLFSKHLNMSPSDYRRALKGV